MKLTLQVPEAVVACARRALAAQQEQPVPEARGAATAARLAAGQAEPSVVAHLFRFFREYARPVQLARDGLQVEETSAILRAWALHGGEAGRAWCEKHYPALRKAGAIPVDPLVPLFDLSVNDVYTRFALGAWRYEYGLDPDKAARFAESYARATGRMLEIGRAFGNAAPAVAQALHRRYHSEDPFRTAVRRVLKDESLRRANLRDVHDLAAGRPCVKETGFQWPSVIGTFALILDHPEHIRPLREQTQVPPKGGTGELTDYADAVREALLFVPHGRSKHPIFAAAPVLEHLRNAWCGRPLQRERVVRDLRALQEGLVRARRVGSAFHLPLACWQSRKWDLLKESIPLDCDVRPLLP